VYVFILCLCFPVFRYWPCDELTTRPRSEMIMKLKSRGQGPRGLYSLWKGNNGQKDLERINNVHFPNNSLIHTATLRTTMNQYVYNLGMHFYARFWPLQIPTTELYGYSLKVSHSHRVSNYLPIV
jgi:hypothetical protein